MFKNILVPLDGSPLAEAALPFARKLAHRTGATLTLVRTAHYSGLLGDLATDQLRAVESAEAYLVRLNDELAAAGLEVVCAVPFGGSTADWIIEESGFRKTDLIIMATHDRIGPDRWLHGSVAEGVVHRSTTPVMLVRAANADQFAERFASHEGVVIVPLDGSELAEAAVPIAQDLSRAIGARIALVGVIPKPGQLVAAQGGAITTYVGSQHSELDAEVRAYLLGVEKRVGINVESIIRLGIASSEIADAAQEYGAAAVVMATHGRTGLIRSVLGSVAGGVVHRTDVPVVLVRKPELRAAEEPAVSATSFAPAD